MLTILTLLAALVIAPSSQELSQSMSSDYDRSLLSTDLWLVDRLPDGSERSQQLRLRGRLGQSQPFFFDDIVESGIALDIFGEFVAQAGNGTIDLKASVHRRLTRLTADKDPAGPFKFGVADFDLRLPPDHVIAFELPAGGTDQGAFAKHALSLRVNTRLIRGSERDTVAALALAQRAYDDVSRQYETQKAEADRERLRQAEADISKLKDMLAAYDKLRNGTQAAPRVFVFGEVRYPGAYAWHEDLTVLQLLSLAGGATAGAAINRTELTRAGPDGKPVTQKVRVSERVNAGDQVFVPRRY